MTPDKTITLPLSEFLLTLWGTKDFSIVDYALGVTIAQIDSDEIFSHVELDNFIRAPQDARDVSTQNKVAKVWRKKDWITTLDKWTKDKNDAELRINEHNRKKEVLDRVTVALAEQFGTTKDDEMVVSIANTMVNKKKIEAILALCEGLQITAEEL